MCIFLSCCDTNVDIIAVININRFISIYWFPLQ